MEQNDKNGSNLLGLNLQGFIIDEVSLEPRYIINDDGEMQITEFAVVPRRDNE